MKDFFKFVFASCLGLFLAMIGIVLFSIIIGAGLAGAAESSGKEVKAGSVLEIKLENNLPELTDNSGERSPFSSDKTVGVHDIVRAIHHAADDDRIKGILIDTRYVMMGFAQLESIRAALETFKQSGKFTVAYADDLSQGGYYLASVADSIMINPNGGVDFRGLAAEVIFLKDMLDRLDVKWQVYYAGQFKSATESFRLDKMSDQNRLQLREYLGGLHNNYLNTIAKARNLSVGELQNIANDYKARTARDAIKYKLVDTEGYYDEMLTLLRGKLGIGGKEKINSIEINDYAQSYTRKMGEGKDRIAVVYAEGDILDGDDDANGMIQGERYARIIRKLREDNNVKAIVLRVNSGGGSSFASDKIWRELELARQQGKPVISSFSDYAASGGYYIAMASDSIFAQENTLTGSIGVFGMIPSFQKTLKNKMGISFDTVKTGKYAASFNTVFDLNDDEGRIIQQGIDSTYEKFLFRVATNRKMTRDQVHAVAQGRIWIAAKAKEVGLIDRIGDLDAAIAAAASKAGLQKYKISEYPKMKDPFQQFIEGFTGQKNNDGVAYTMVKEQMGEYGVYLDMFKRMQQVKSPQMRLPMVLKVK